MVSRVRLAEFITPDLSLGSYVLWGKLLYLSIPKFPISKMEIIIVQASLGLSEE